MQDPVLVTSVVIMKRPPGAVETQAGSETTFTVRAAPQAGAGSKPSIPTRTPIKNTSSSRIHSPCQAHQPRAREDERAARDDRREQRRDQKGQVLCPAMTLDEQRGDVRQPGSHRIGSQQTSKNQPCGNPLGS